MTNKYGAKKTVVGQKVFDSSREAKRYAELMLMQKGKVISDLRCQVPFELIPAAKRDDGKTERAVKYVADFVYKRDGHTVVEDAKGFKTPQYIIKRKLMLMVWGISVMEV